jgi:thiol:disulfide interchange protein DsbD
LLTIAVLVTSTSPQLQSLFKTNKTAVQPATTNTFRTITNLAKLNTAIAQAKQQHRPILLYFHANWCLYCKEYDSIFTNQEIQQQLHGFVLLQIDLSKKTSGKQAIMQHYKVFGLPTLLFFNSSGNEQKDFRLAESMSLADFKQHLSKLIASITMNNTKSTINLVSEKYPAP